MNEIDITQIKYDLALILPNGNRLNLTDLISSLRWEENASELAVRLQFTVLNRTINGQLLHEQIKLGGRTLLRADWGQGWREIHSGIIFDWDYTQDGNGKLSIKAYDMLIYLLRSKDDRWYKAGTQAAVIIKDIAKAWSIPIGQNDLPSVSLSAQAFRSQALAAMLTTVLNQVRNQGKGQFVIRSTEGKIHVLKTGQNKSVYRFDSDMVSIADDRLDIEDLVTRIKIVGKKAGEIEPKKKKTTKKTKKKTRVPLSATLDGRTEFGVLQDVIYSGQYDTNAAAMAAAKEVLKERGQPRRRSSVVVPDLPFLRRGDKVYLAAGTLLGYYIVDGIQHNADNQTMTMEVSPDE